MQYYSQQLSDVQKRWSTIEKEAYSIFTSVNKLRPYLFASKFTIFTDHQPLTSLFSKKMLNTKLQRWALALSEYDAPIIYHRGYDNVRADMLSRPPKSMSSIAVIDVDNEWTDPVAFPDDIAFTQLPCLVDGLDLANIAAQQKAEFPNLFNTPDNEEDSPYIVMNNILYSTQKPTAYSATYPRLVLPSDHRENIIWRAHKETGHMSTLKTLDRVRESYFWPGMRQQVRKLLAQCTTCIAHSKRRDQTEMGEMPTPVSPMQMVSLDLCGPFPTSSLGNRYVLNIICHLTGWAESYCIPDKTNESVWRMFSNHFIPAHGIPEVVLSDNGREFTAKAFTNYLGSLGIDHRRTTPQNPRCDGRIERFNRTFKETLTKLINNNPGSWENHVGDTLFSHRISISSVTGYSPFYLMYGRQPRAPLTKLLQASTKVCYFGNRLDNLAEAMSNAQHNSKEARIANRERLAKQANAKNVHVGDTVVLLAPERLTFTSAWDHQWQVTRVSGLTCHLRNQVDGRTKIIHRDHIKIVDPHLAWDSLPPRPKRTRHRPVWDKPDPVLNKADKPLSEDNPNLENILDCDVTDPNDPVLHNPTDSDLTRPPNTFEPHTFDPSLQLNTSLDSDTSDKLSINLDTSTNDDATVLYNPSNLNQTNSDQLHDRQIQAQQGTTKRRHTPSPYLTNTRRDPRLRNIKRVRYDHLLDNTPSIDDDMEYGS